MILEDQHIKEAIEPFIGKNRRTIAKEAGINPGNFNVAWNKCKFSSTMKIKLSVWLERQIVGKEISSFGATKEEAKKALHVLEK